MRAETNQGAITGAQLLLTTSLLAGIALSAAAYGYDPGMRAVTSGLLGVRTGAAVGSLSGNAGAGALIGGAGEVGGTVTTPRY